MGRRIAVAVIVIGCLLLGAIAVWHFRSPAPGEAQIAQPTSSIPANPSAATSATPGSSQPVATIDSPATPAEGQARLEQVGKAIKPEDYGIDALAAKLDTIDTAFAFVRDQIRFESYDGLLRGGKGTLLARAGNAADRAMLLAAVLQRHKIPVRIATGQLSEPDAERLFARMFDVPVASPPAARSALTQRIFARGERDYHTMLNALGGAPPPVAAPSHADVIREIQRHAWVQAQRDGQWVDLDSSFGDSTPGRAYAPVGQTFDGPPQPLMQQVTIRVVAETLTDGKLARTVALESTAPASQLADKQIYLLHHRPPPPMGDTRAAPLQRIFENPDVWQPLLVVAGNLTDGAPIDFGAGASAAGSARNPGQQVLDAFGGPPEGGNGPTFVAEWLEFEVKLPNGGTDVTRRTLVDRASTAWRHAGTLDASRLKDLPRSGKTLLAPQALYNIWISTGKHDLLAFANSAAALLNGTIPRRTANARPAFTDQIWPLAMRDLSWIIESDHLIVPAVNDTPGVRLYADSPRIFVWGAGPDLDVPNGGFMQADLRRDRLRGVARDASASTIIAQHKLWFGALEGALEHEMGLPPHPDPKSWIVTTSSLAEGSDVVRVGPGLAFPSASDPETTARLKAALATGDTLVVPKRVLAGGISGWWQISRDTGDVRATLDDDLGGALGGKTSGGYTKGPTKITLPGGGGEPKVPSLPQDPEYYTEDIHALAHYQEGEFAEEEADLQVTVQVIPVWQFVAAATLDAASLGLLVWEILHPGQL